jgi:hypothetical protein
MATAFLDLGGKLVVELVFQECDLGKKLLFNVFGHHGPWRRAKVAQVRKR